MASSYPLEVRYKCEQLYIEEGFTFEEVSESSKRFCGNPQGVSVSQLKRWSDEDKGIIGKSWKEQQDETQEALRFTRREKILLKRDLLIEARTTKNPQTIYAFARLDKEPAAGNKPKEEVKAPDIDRPALFLEDLQFIATILKETDPEGLKVLAHNFDLIVDRFKAQYAQTA
ncbi:MAG: hypothetical protein ACYC6G_14125 [Desulfobaccales bacterium]